MRNDPVNHDINLKSVIKFQIFSSITGKLTLKEIRGLSMFQMLQ